MDQVPGIYTDYDKNKRILNVTSIDQKAIQRATMIHEMYFKDAKTKESLRQKKEDISKMVQNNQNHSDTDYVEEFT